MDHDLKENKYVYQPRIKRNLNFVVFAFFCFVSLLMLSGKRLLLIKTKRKKQKHRQGIDLIWLEESMRFMQCNVFFICLLLFLYFFCLWQNVKFIVNAIISLFHRHMHDGAICLLDEEWNKKALENRRLGTVLERNKNEIQKGNWMMLPKKTENRNKKENLKWNDPLEALFLYLHRLRSK